MKGKTPAQKADELGASYAEGGEQESAGKKRKEEAKAQIMTLAEKVGVQGGKSLTIKGDEFEVGFSVTTPSPSLDEDIARTLLAPKVLKKCRKEYIDEKLFVECVERGEVSKADVKKILKHTRAPYKRVVVKKINP